MAKRRRIIRSLAFAAIINVVVLLIVVAVLEFVGRCYVRTPRSPVVSSLRVNHTWRPSSTSTHHEWVRHDPRFPQPYTHTYNRQGWVETYDIAKTKPAGTYRIFYVGDSFVEGTVPMDQSLPSIVEQRLNERTRDRDLRIEVVNTGTTSYSPLIHYVLIRYVIADYAPDLIVVNIDMTDEFDDWKYWQTAIFDDDGNPVAVPPRSLYTDAFVDTEQGAVKATLRARIELLLFRHSHFYNLLRARRSTKEPGGTAPEMVYPRWAWCQPEWSEATVKNVGRTLGMIERMARFCRARAIKLMVTSVPHYSQYAGDLYGSLPPRWSSRPHEVIARVCEQTGTPYLNSFERLAPLIRGKPQHVYYYRRDMHFNPRGYDVWAAAHVEFLVDPANRLLPDEAYGAGSSP